MARYDLDLFSDPLHTSSDDQGEGEAWMVSYLDVMTLLIAFFVLLLALSEPRLNDDRIPDHATTCSTAATAADDPQPAPPTLMTPTREQAAATGVMTTNDGVLPDGAGLLPAYNALLPARSGESLPDAIDLGITDSGSPADYEERFGALQDSLNSLSLQGVDATPGREGLTLRIADNLLFASGESELSYDGMMLISQLQGVLAEFTGEISIEGHTDNIPINTVRFPSNWELSSARAIAVLRYLEFGGMRADRMRAVGYADTQPLENNSAPQGRAANRRVELILREL